MTKVCQSDLGNTGEEFGEKLRKTLKSKADSMVAFGKLADRVEQNAWNKNQSSWGPLHQQVHRWSGHEFQVVLENNPKLPLCKMESAKRYFNQNQQREQGFSKPKTP